METLKVQLLTPEQKILNGELVTELSVHAHKGQLGIYPGHSDIVTLLDSGVLSVIHNGEKRNFAISWGYLELVKGRVSILVDHVATRKDVSQVESEKSIAELEQKIAKQDFDSTALLHLQRDLAWEQAKLSLLQFES